MLYTIVLFQTEYYWEHILYHTQLLSDSAPSPATMWKAAISGMEQAAGGSKQTDSVYSMCPISLAAGDIKILFDGQLFQIEMADLWSTATTCIQYTRLYSIFKKSSQSSIYLPFERELQICRGYIHSALYRGKSEVKANIDQPYV